uniref:Uncharacterized protein n=1 Tax=Oryza sativa subsp. japonica TaxID=39947 RepID=Q6ZKY6_ORYSJ|nr:hypothetical protein [Oryza sativa Japonica Group]
MGSVVSSAYAALRSFVDARIEKSNRCNHRGRRHREEEEEEEEERPSPASELEDVFLVKTSKPLKVDSTKVEQISHSKDAIGGPLQTRKDKVQGKVVDALPQKVLCDAKVDGMDAATADSRIPEDRASPSFVSPLSEENALIASGSDVKINDSAVQPEVSTEAKMTASSAKVTTKDKGKTQISDVVYDKAHDINSLASIEKCLELYLETEEREWACENCSKVVEKPGIMSSTKEDTTAGDQSEQSEKSAYQVEENQNEQKDKNECPIQTRLIRKLPPVLTIHLMRYLEDFKKVIGHVSFKEILDVGQFIQDSEFEGYSMQDSQQIAERGDSHSLASELEDVVTVKTSEPLKVDSTKMEQITQNKDAVHGPLKTQKDKVQGKAVDVLPQKVLYDVKVDRINVATADSLIPEDPASQSFVSPLREENALASGSDDEKNDSAVQPEVSTEAKRTTSSVKVTTEDKGKTQISDVVYDKAQDIESLASIECLELHFEAKMIEWANENCSIILVEYREPIMSSTKGDTTDGNQSEHSEKIICQSEQSYEKKLFPEVGTCNTDIVQAIVEGRDSHITGLELEDVTHVAIEETDDLKRSLGSRKVIGHVSFEKILDMGLFMDPSSGDKDNSHSPVGVVEHQGLRGPLNFLGATNWLPCGFFWRRGGPQAPEPEFSWISVMGDPVINTDGSCTIAAATVCIEAQHRLAFERLYGKGSFPCKAKVPKELKKACYRQGIWSSEEGAWTPDVLLMIMEKGGILTQRVPNNIQLAIDGFFWLERNVAFGKLEFMRLLYAYGPLLSTLWTDDGYAQTFGDRVYRGLQKDPDSGDHHCVVCFAYRVDSRTNELYVRIMDNCADDGPIRWVLFDVFDSFYVPLIKKSYRAS